MTSQDIRKKFLIFFRKKNHHILPSASIVTRYDPTLIFVNAGMNSLKDYFIGKKKIIFSSIASIQKCLRVSGKHNDLEDVGKDSYHHTMFEMLGNWYFGSCVKEQSIKLAWELLTEVYKISKNNIYVTIFSGDSEEGISIDEKSKFYWNNFLKKEHIFHYKKKHNFWEMSNIGPCGPCSEIHVDLRSYKDKKKKPVKDLINKDHPQIIELWNLVFMEFFRHERLEKLSERHVDTGMGFERLCRILQHKNSNYDTDLFSFLIRKIEELSNIIYGIYPNIDVAIRVVVDHIRSISFAIADGQNPSNTGAGYVIRRILRRTIIYGYRFLFQKKAFLYQIVGILVKEMGMYFPELIVKKKCIIEKIYIEEVFFFKTLKKGLKRLENIIHDIKIKKKKSIDGIIIFELFDTFGFPMDLSRLLAKENDLAIDEVGFKRELNLQRERSRNINSFKTDNWTIIDGFNRENFVCYDKLSLYVYISRFRQVKKNRNIYYQIIFSTTNFYAHDMEKVGDKGIIENEIEKIPILNTIKDKKIFLHITENIPKFPEKAFKATVDKYRRKSIEKNHSVTHLLHYALKIVLNDVTQKGSYFIQNRLRFDFSSHKKITNDHIQNIEGVVQEIIYQKFPLKKNQCTIDKKVKSIRFGPIVDLCSGIHVNNTGDINMFKIISENSIGSYIHRIEAITSIFAIKYLNNIQEEYQLIFEEMKQNNKTYLSKIEVLRFKEIQRIKTDWLFKAKHKNNFIIICEITNLDSIAIKTISIELRNQGIEMIIIIVNVLDLLICISISNKLINIYGMNARKILKKISTTTIYSEYDNKGLAIAKVKNIRWVTDTLKLVNSWNEIDYYL